MWIEDVHRAICIFAKFEIVQCWLPLVAIRKGRVVVGDIASWTYAQFLSALNELATVAIVVFWIVQLWRPSVLANLCSQGHSHIAFVAILGSRIERVVATRSASKSGGCEIHAQQGNQTG